MKNIKKLVSFALCGAISLSLLSFSFAQTPKNTEPVFDNQNIVLSFGALSDIHLIGDPNAAAEKKFEKALDSLKEKTNNKLDAVFVAGDLTDFASSSQIQQFKRIFDEKAKVNGTELIYALGNHDHYYDAVASQFSSVFGDEYFTKDIDKQQINKGNRFVELNGYYFVSVEVNDYYNSGDSCTYNSETKKWLIEKLDYCTQKNPNKPVFIATHSMIYDTVYGSTLEKDGPAWYSKDIIPILKNYPQTITFSGHLHFPLEDERSIMQTDFTSVGCSSVNYMGLESGYTDMPNLSSTVPNDAYNFSQGLLVEVDKNNNTKITRMDFFNNRECGQPWIIPAPKNDKSHLSLYTKDRANSNKPPVFSSSENVSYTINNGRDLNISVNKADDDQMVHHYIAQLSLDGSDDKPLQIKTLSGFYRTQLPSSISFNFKKLLLGETYTLKIFAVDSWDAKSEPIIKKITIPSGDINQQLLIPDIFNLNFEKNKAVNTASSNYSISEFGKINTVFDNYLKSFVYQLNSSTKDFSQFIINNNDEEKLTKQFTCDVIFKANEFSNIEQQIVSNNAAGGFAIIIPANSKKVAISAMIGGKKIMLESKDDIKLDKYYQATATFDGDEFVFYLNGEVQKRLTQSGVLTIPKANENFFVIGAKPAKSGAFTNYFSGMIYNFKLYSTALNKTHINEIINHNIFNNNFIIGDVNKDNKINTLDALFILKHCAKIITLDEEQIALADFSGDGKLNTLDALCILKKIVETNN